MYIVFDYLDTDTEVLHLRPLYTLSRVGSFYAQEGIYTSLASHYQILLNPVS